MTDVTVFGCVGDYSRHRLLPRPLSRPVPQELRHARPVPQLGGLSKVPEWERLPREIICLASRVRMDLLDPLGQLDIAMPLFARFAADVPVGASGPEQG